MLITFNTNGGAFSGELLNNLNIDNSKGENATPEEIILEFDNHDIITLPNNNDLNKTDYKLLGWGLEKCNDNGIVEGKSTHIKNIFKGTYIPTQNVTLYAVWDNIITESNNPNYVPEIVIDLNKTVKESVETTPFISLSEKEQQSVLNNTERISKVTFIAVEEKLNEKNELEKVAHKWLCKYKGSDWTLSQVIADESKEGDDDTIYKTFIEDNGLQNNTIVWYRKGIKVNDYDVLYDGDILNGIVYPTGDKHLFALPIVTSNEDELRNYLTTKYQEYESQLPDDINFGEYIKGVNFEGELYHTSQLIDGKNFAATNYGTVIIYNNLTNSESFNSNNGDVKYHVDTNPGFEYTLVAEPKDGCRFIGWYRREENIINTESDKIYISYPYIGYYKISSMNESKINVIVEEKDIYNQFGALFVGKPETNEFPECKFDIIDTNVTYEYYYWNGTNQYIENFEELRGLKNGNNITVLLNQDGKEEYINIFTKNSLNKDYIKITPEVLDDFCYIGESKPITYIGGELSDDIKNHLSEKGFEYVLSIWLSSDFTTVNKTITIEIIENI